MNWKYGFSTAIELDDQKERVTNYVMKYITKDNQKNIQSLLYGWGKEFNTYRRNAIPE